MASVAVDGNLPKEGEAPPASPLAGKDLRDIALGGSRASAMCPDPPLCTEKRDGA